MPKFYISTAIPDVNDDPHIGHTYENIVADVIARHRQMNDIFGTFGIAPRTGISINMSSDESLRIYGYASEVRNDTGDAVFVFGMSPNC